MLGQPEWQLRAMAGAFFLGEARTRRDAGLDAVDATSRLIRTTRSGWPIALKIMEK